MLQTSLCSQIWQLTKIDQFFKNYELPNLNQGVIDNIIL